MHVNRSEVASRDSFDGEHFSRSYCHAVYNTEWAKKLHTVFIVYSQSISVSTVMGDRLQANFGM